MLTLRNTDVAAEIDPGRGLTVRSLVKNGREFMATVPWKPADPVHPATPTQWVDAWAGGWQPTLPNAGFAAPKANQGYHGAASQQPWEVSTADGERITAQWRDPVFTVDRTVNLESDGITVHTSAVNNTSEPRPMIITEHLVLGSSVLEGPATIEAPGTTVYPLDNQSQQQLPGAPWPGEPDWSYVVPYETPGRCAAVTAPADGVRIKDVRITWDTTALPYFWLWQELAANRNPPWNGETLALGIEPATTPHGQGLDAGGERPLLQPGARFSWWVRISLG